MYEEVLNKMRRYCAYQERCHEEVRTKILSMKVYGDTLERVMDALIQEDFLNEERFAIAYAGGKFRMKKWGRLKILRELQLRKISTYCINKAMKEITDEAYEKTLKQLIHQARKSYSTYNTFEQNHKVSKYLIAKGYEPALVWQYLGKDDH